MLQSKSPWHIKFCFQINIREESLNWPLLMGIHQNHRTGKKPGVCFRIKQVPIILLFIVCVVHIGKHFHLCHFSKVFIMLFQLVPSSRPFEFQGFNELAGCIWLGFHVVNH